MTKREFRNGSVRARKGKICAICCNFVTANAAEMRRFDVLLQQSATAGVPDLPPALSGGADSYRHGFYGSETWRGRFLFSGAAVAVWLVLVCHPVCRMARGSDPLPRQRRHNFISFARFQDACGIANILSESLKGVGSW